MKTKPAFLFAFLFVAMIAAGQNPRNNLIEKGSSTSCDECICIDSILQNCVLPVYPHSILVIYHNWGSGLKCEQCDTLTRYLLKDQSELRTNRDGVAFKYYGWENFHRYCDTVKEYISTHTDAPLQLSVNAKAYDAQTRKVTVTLQAKPYESALSGTFLINAVIIENKVLFQQSMDSMCGGYSGKRPCYHNNVARTMAYQYGDIIKSGNWEVNDVVSREFSFTMDQKWDENQSFVVVYVYRQSDELGTSEIQQAVVQSVTGSLADGGELQKPVNIVSLFPNPVAQYATATISVATGGMVAVKIADMTGQVIRKILEKQLSRGVYDIGFRTDGLSVGNYLLLVEKDGRVYQSKFIIARP